VSLTKLISPILIFFIFPFLLVLPLRYLSLLLLSWLFFLLSLSNMTSCLFVSNFIIFDDRELLFFSASDGEAKRVVFVKNFRRMDLGRVLFDLFLIILLSFLLFVAFFRPVFLCSSVFLVASHLV